VRSETRSSPYQGLVPYTEDDADWFFGRETWSAIVIDNLRAYRLSVLYGSSGVGKSSLLNAGVVRQLREEARRSVEEDGVPQHAVVTFGFWSTADPTSALKIAIRASVESVAPELAPDAPSGSLADVVSAWSERIHGPLLIVLDQFEEYFLYHPLDAGPGSFDEELAVALRRRDTPANFLLSIREDAVAQLDRFEGRVPGLLDNLLRIEHLDHLAAREAIERPIQQWNRLEAAPGEEVEIEPALVDAVLEQVETGKVLVGAGGAGVAAAGEARIEAPYLQLVLTRLWDEELAAGSRVLRLETLERLGGAERMVRTHVDSTMRLLPHKEQEIAARIFRYLVTPSGTKIAHRDEDLAEYSDVSIERLEPLVGRLAGEARILRPIGEDSHEIYHDALAGPILDWRRRYEDSQSRRLLRHALLLSISAALSAIVMAAYLGGALHGWDAKTLDIRFSIRGVRAANNVSLVAIDDSTFQALKLRWPFPRTLHARVIDRICSSHPRAVVIDIQFSEPGTVADDNALGSALLRCQGRTVLATTEFSRSGQPNLIFGRQWLREIGARFGNALLSTDADGVVRDLPYSTAKGESLSLVAAELALGRAIRPSELGGSSTYIDYAGPAGTVSATPYWQVLRGGFRPGSFRDKVVIVGATAPALQDVHKTPTSESMSGPEVQANAVETALRGFPLRSHKSLDLALIALLGLTVPVASLRIGRWKSCALGLVVAGLYVGSVQLAFNGGLLLPVIYPLIALALGTILVLASGTRSARHFL
jgi:CHASE2 domain-containing sensor protein